MSQAYFDRILNQQADAKMPFRAYENRTATVSTTHQDYELDD